MKTIIILFLCCSINLATAAGDSQIGQTKAIICMGCHGVDGNNDNTLYPVLAGQGEGYLVKQLADFKSGARKEEHMSSMVEAISLSDIPHIAAYFSKQKRKVTNSEKKEFITGQLIYNQGIPSKDVTACSDCHGKDAMGNTLLKFPALAGQHAAYISKMLKEFQVGKRYNDKNRVMRNLVAKLSNDEIQALSIYIKNLN